MDYRKDRRNRFAVGFFSSLTQRSAKARNVGLEVATALRLEILIRVGDPHWLPR